MFSGTEILELNLKNTLGASRDIAQSDDQFFNLFELGADLKLTVPRILAPFNKKISSFYNVTKNTNYFRNYSSREYWLR